MEGILEVMIAFKKAIFTLLSFLIVFGGFLGVPERVLGQTTYSRGQELNGLIVDTATTTTATVSVVNDTFVIIVFTTPTSRGTFQLRRQGGSSEYTPYRIEYNSGSSPRIPNVSVGETFEDYTITRINVQLNEDSSISGYSYSVISEDDLQGSIAVNPDGSINTAQTNLPDVPESLWGAVWEGFKEGVGNIAGAASAIADPFGSLLTKAKAIAQSALGYVLAGIAIIINQLNHTMIGIAGSLFEVSLTETVANLGKYISPGQGAGDSIVEAWELFRNLANLIFIFLILFVAIKTILQGNGFGDKRLLGGIIIVALFMNFSLLFTKVFIDASNAASVSLYNAITYDEATQTRKSIGITLVSHLKLTTFSNASIPEQLSNMSDDFDSNALQFLMALIATPLFLITTLGLALTAASLILRLISFIFLLIFSPVAFVSTLMPGKAFWNKWLNALVSNSISLPALLIGLYLTLILAEGVSGALSDAGDGFAGLYGVFTSFFGKGVSQEETIRASIEALTSFVKLLINYTIIMASLFFAFWGSRKIGFTGGSWAAAAADTKTKMVKYGLRPARGVVGGVTGFAGRNTAGRVGSLLSNNNFVREKAARRGVVGALARKTQGAGATLASSSFGGTEGGLVGRQALAEKETNRLLEARKNLGEFSSPKEQKAKNKYDQALAVLTNTSKKHKDTERDYKASLAEEEALVKEFIKTGVATDSQKTSYETADREVKRLEKLKKKNGSLSATDETALGTNKTDLKNAKNMIFQTANTSPTLSEEKKKILVDVQTTTSSFEGADGKIEKTKGAETAAKARFAQEKVNFKGVEGKVKARVTKFDKDIEKKTLNITRHLIRSQIRKGMEGYNDRVAVGNTTPTNQS